MATKRASLEELKKFANKVRKAGGGNPLDALMPAVPSDAHQCLIAKNLNFNCMVYPAIKGPGKSWAMWTDEATRDQIASKLKLKKIDEDLMGERHYGVLLPAAIGQVADDFDSWEEAIEHSAGIMTLKKNAPKQLKRLKEFWPYIEESTKEVYRNAGADFINDKGELIL